MKADWAALLIGVGVGAVIVLLIYCGLIAIGPPREQAGTQVSIQEEKGKMIDTLQLDSYRNIGVYHDNKRNVTCWIDLNKGGISCIPDHMLSP